MPTKPWEETAKATLDASLSPLPHEKNELDWKSALSENTEKLAHHISAFANSPGGGFLVFGVGDDGSLVGVKEGNYLEMAKRLGNIARQSVVPAIRIDYSILSYKDVELLFVYIPESIEKPVHYCRGTIYDSYIRSAGQTRKMTRTEVARAIATSAGVSFEQEAASEEISAEQVIKYIDIQSFFDLLNKPFPTDTNAIIEELISENFIKRVNSLFIITNLGALLCAKKLYRLFPLSGLDRKAVRVINYEKADRLRTLKEREFTKGYAAGFETIIQYINDQIPSNEIIGQALRQEVKLYPELAIRELVANALIHQDFQEIGTGPMVEIFPDRVEITNPGRPLVNTMRFIDTPPQSRNEMIAAFMRRINICEERGSGIDKVIAAVELAQLPPPEFIETENHTKVVLYAPRPFGKMEKEEKVRACYQHCCLKYVSGSKMSNQSIRERFNIGEKNYPVASKIIRDTLDANLIKLASPGSKSRKHATYIPFWA
ncbi:MAG: putative DNA binding domain-containing protein [Candidatus Brocadia sp.]|nr:putative DNA binding domain-containing protein [Candidatus Brocadia sp.]